MEPPQDFVNVETMTVLFYFIPFRSQRFSFSLHRLKVLSDGHLATKSQNIDQSMKYGIRLPGRGWYTCELERNYGILNFGRIRCSKTCIDFPHTASPVITPMRINIFEAFFYLSKFLLEIQHLSVLQNHTTAIGKPRGFSLIRFTRLLFDITHWN